MKLINVTYNCLHLKLEFFQKFESMLFSFIYLFIYLFIRLFSLKIKHDSTGYQSTKALRFTDLQRMLLELASQHYVEKIPNLCDPTFTLTIQQLKNQSRPHLIIET